VTEDGTDSLEGEEGFGIPEEGKAMTWGGGGTKAETRRNKPNMIPVRYLDWD
jgi:hypothetical protein